MAQRPFRGTLALTSPGYAMKEPVLDADLVLAARAGSSAAFGELALRYRSPLVQLAYSLTHDADEAKDIAQDTLIRAYRRLPSFHADRPFSRWLFVIARNASLDAIRSRRRRTLARDPLSENAVEPSSEDVALQNEAAAALHAALAALPSQYRTALELYYLQGLRYREIAERLEIPIGTVKTYILRGKRRLRAALYDGALAAAA